MLGEWPSEVSVGALVWSSTRPLVKVLLMLLSGGIFARYGGLTPQNAKIVSSLILNLLYPCLLFAKTLISVESIRPDSFGILLLAAIFYLLLGGLTGYFLRCRLNPPREFRNGTIVACMFGNWGDLTNAVILSLGESAPFKPGDTAVGIAFTSIFCVPLTVVIYTLGYSLIKSDFNQDDQEAVVLGCQEDPSLAAAQVNAKSKRRFNRATILRYATVAAKSLLTPPNVSIIFALIIGNIAPLKALFIGAPSDLSLSTRTAAAPLGFVYESIDFLGNASIQLGIINIGAAFYRVAIDFIARLRCKSDKLTDDSSPFTRKMLLLSAAITASRFILYPIVGILFWEVLLVRCVHWIAADNVMLRFILMFQATVPTAQMTVVLSQAFDPTGEGRFIAAAAFMQYLLASIAVSGWLIAIFILLHSPIN